MKISANKVGNMGGLDVGKFIMAIVVVAIHTQPLTGSISGIGLATYRFLIALAVPFFFMASGFLLAQKIMLPIDYEQSCKVLNRYLFKISKLYLIWTILYLPLTVFGFYQEHTDPSFAFVLFIRNVLLRGENYYSWPLWYLLALIYTLITLFFFLKKRITPQYILVYAIGSYFIICSWDMIVNAFEAQGYVWLHLWQNTFASVRVFTALTFVVLGLYLGLTQRYWSKPFILTTGIGAIVLGSFENLHLSELCILLAAYALFQWFLLTYSTLSPALGKNLRKASTVIYFTHMLVFFAYQFIFSEIQMLQWSGFLFTVLATIGLSLLVLKFEQRIPWLNQIF